MLPMDRTTKGQNGRAGRAGRGVLRVIGFAACVMTVMVGIAGGMGGCAFEKHREELARMHAAGQYAQAAAKLDDPKTDRLYDEGDEVLRHMDRGAVALALGDTGRAITEFEDAKRETEFNDQKSGGEVLAEWLLNDNARRYIAEPYEDMYLSVLTMVALLEEGRIEPGAANEARRFGLRSNVLRDRFAQQVGELERRSGDNLRKTGWKGENPKGEFVESPLGAYLASLAYMASGQADNQRIAAEHVRDAVKTQAVGVVKEEDFAGLASVTPETANVVVVAFSGRGPTKKAFRLPPIVIDKVTFYAEVPVLVKSQATVTGARVEFEAGEGGTTKVGVPLALIEDMTAVAEQHYEREMPLIQGRAIARAAARAVGAYFITETVDKSNHRKNDTARWLTEIGLLVAQIAVERADVRCWAFMPGQARVATLKLPPGPAKYRVVYEGAGGGYTTPWKTIVVGGGGGQSGNAPLVAAVAHYWN